MVPLVLADLDQKAKASHVDAQDWHIAGTAQVPGAQHGAIPAQGDQQIELARLDAAVEGFVVQKAGHGLQVIARQCLGDLFGFFSSANQLGVGNDGDAVE